MSDEAKKRVGKAKRNNGLPWWVEILFVQIGLPDSLLRWFLKTRKKAYYTLSEHKKPIALFLLISSFIIYLEPIVTKAKRDNECIESAHYYLKTNKKLSLEKQSSISVALAHHICNGGNLKFLE